MKTSEIGNRSRSNHQMALRSTRIREENIFGDSGDIYLVYPFPQFLRETRVTRFGSTIPSGSRKETSANAESRKSSK